MDRYGEIGRAWKDWLDVGQCLREIEKVDRLADFWKEWLDIGLILASFRDIGQSLVSLRDIGRFWEVSARLKEYGIDIERLEELWWDWLDVGWIWERWWEFERD